MKLNTAHEKDGPIHLLWTGGWDSTFRLLQMVLHYRISVQPHYVVDLGRPSTFQELKTMALIKSRITSSDSTAGDRVLPLNVVLLSDLPPSESLTTRYLQLKKNTYLGTQYEWLPCFAESHHLNGLEICIAKHPKLRGIQSLLAERVVQKFDRPDGPYWELPELSPNNALTLFSRFRFPTLYSSKLDMKEEAHDLGFLDLLELAWFCHTPVQGETCGLCVPCRDAMADGMAYRLDHSGQVRNRKHLYKKDLVKGVEIAKSIGPRAVRKLVRCWS